MANLWPTVLGHGAELGANQTLTNAHVSATPFVWGELTHTFRIPTTAAIHLQVRLRQEGTLTDASVINEALLFAINVDGVREAIGNWRPPNGIHMQMTVSMHTIVQLAAGAHTIKIEMYLFNPLAGTVYTVVAPAGQKANFWSLLGIPQDGQVY